MSVRELVSQINLSASQAMPAGGAQVPTFTLPLTPGRYQIDYLSAGQQGAQYSGWQRLAGSALPWSVDYELSARTVQATWVKPSTGNASGGRDFSSLSAASVAAAALSPTRFALTEADALQIRLPDDQAADNAGGLSLAVYRVTNSPPTGSVTLAGSPVQGQVLTASHSLVDPDGLGTIAYQWLMNGAVIAGSTGPTLVVSAMHLGQSVAARATYTDTEGFTEAVTSAALTVPANSRIEGTSGGDTLNGTAQADLIQGFSGSDVLIGAAGDDRLDGGADGTWGDTADYRAASSGVMVDLQTGAVTGGAGNDFLTDIEHLNDSAFGDQLRGNAKRNWFRLTAGNDLADGRDSIDTVMYQDASSAVSINLATGTATGPGIGSDTLISIEGAHGSAFDDVIQLSDAVGSYVFGEGGHDLLTGGSSNDGLTGGAGNDTIQGGAGIDSAAYRVGAVSDRVTFAADGAGAWRVKAGTLDLLTIAQSSDAFQVTDLRAPSLATTDAPLQNTDTIRGVETISVDAAVTAPGSATASTITVLRLALPAASAGALAPTVSYQFIGGTDGPDTLMGSENISDSIAGYGGDDSLSGLSGADSLSGGTGNDTLVGSLGDDRFYPGAGSDSIDGGEQRRYPGLSTAGDYDRIDYTGSGALTIDLAQRTVVVAGETGTDRYSGIEEIQGTTNADTITGRVSSSASDAAVGGSSLYLYLRGGSDLVDLLPAGPQQAWSDGVYVGYHWSASPVTVTTTSNTWTVNYGAASGQAAGTDTLRNVGLIGDSAYSDRIDVSGLRINHLGYVTSPLDGSSYNALLMGRGGSDTVIGNGLTTVNYGAVDGARDGVTGLKIDLRQASSDLSNLSTAGVALGTLTFSGVRGVHGTRFNDTMIGGVADNDEFESFRGDGGNDYIDGGPGIDRAEYRYANEGVTILLAAGQASSESSGSDTLRSIEIIRGSMFADTYDARGFGGAANRPGDAAVAPATGSAASTLSTPNVGSRWWGYNGFVPEGGDDTIHGNGSTLLAYDQSMLAIQADLRKGVVDALEESAKLTPAYASLGRDTFSGVYGVLGSNYGDLLIGGGPGRLSLNPRAEFFYPGAGADTIQGGGGWDIVEYPASPQGIDVDMSRASGQVVNDGWGDTDTVTGIENLVGSYYADRFKGSDRSNTFNGLRGADSFDGAFGHDEIDFGALFGAQGIVVMLEGWVGASGALPSGYTGSAIDAFGDIDVFTDIEGVEGSRDNDRITGDGNNNRLDGRGGSDTLDGGAGLDWAEYNQATLGIIVNLAEGRAQDDGQAASDEGPDSRVDADVLISIENVQGGIAGDRITGDAGPNVIEGGPGNDTLFGAAGQDVVVFGGARGGYTVTPDATGAVWVRDNRGADRFDASAGTWTISDGTDQVTGFERYQFGDMLLAQPDPVRLPKPVIDLGMFEGRALRLTHPYVAPDGRVYYVVDGDGNGRIELADSTSHVWLDKFFNQGNDRFDNQPQGAVAGVDDARTALRDGFTLVNPTTTEIVALRQDLKYYLPAGWRFEDIDYDWVQNVSSATRVAADVHHNISLVNDGIFTNLYDSYGYNGLFIVQALGNVWEPTPDLGGRVYHWKSHQPIDQVTITLTGGDAVAPTPTSLFSLRNIRSTAAGDLQVDLWADPAAPVSRFDLDFEFAADRSVGFLWAPDLSGWSFKLFSVDQPGTLNLSAASVEQPLSGPVRLGTITIDSLAGSSSIDLSAVAGRLGSQLITPFQTRFAQTQTGLDGRWSLEKVEFGDYALLARHAPERGVVDSEDALSALMLAVGRNPNADPDGAAGPKRAALVAPYQFMSADVDRSGQVDSNDVYEILKMAVGRADALPADWLFVNEDYPHWDPEARGGAGAFTSQRRSVDWAGTTIAVEAGGAGEINLVGTVRGDVNGSWRAAEAVAPLPDSYFESLALTLGAPLDQWGYPG